MVSCEELFPESISNCPSASQESSSSSFKNLKKNQLSRSRSGGIFSNPFKSDRDKMDQLTELLNQYSTHGIPEVMCNRLIRASSQLTLVPSSTSTSSIASLAAASASVSSLPTVPTSFISTSASPVLTAVATSTSGCSTLPPSASASPALSCSSSSTTSNLPYSVGSLPFAFHQSFSNCKTHKQQQQQQQTSHGHHQSQIQQQQQLQQHLFQHQQQQLQHHLQHQQQLQHQHQQQQQQQQQQLLGHQHHHQNVIFDQSVSECAIDNCNSSIKSSSPTNSTIGMGDEFFLEENWRQIVKNASNLDKKTQGQQDALWELISTEVFYIKRLKVITDLFLACLVSLQCECLLLDIEPAKMFSNIDEVAAANLHFWNTYLAPMLNASRDNGQPLDQTYMMQGFLKFDQIFNPYIKYCLDHSNCLQYVKEKHKENELFKAYLVWCETRKDCERLRLMDLLVKPMQRLTKYSLLLKAIMRKTESEGESLALKRMNECVEQFVLTVDASLRRKHEEDRLCWIASRIESYEAIDITSDEIEKVVKDYCKLDFLLKPMLECRSNQMRQLILEGSNIKLKDSNSSGKLDVHLFLFTDLLLICKKSISKKSNDKVKVIRPPLLVNRITPITFDHTSSSSSSKDTSSMLVLIYTNEFGVAAAVLILYTSECKTWQEQIRKAQKKYSEAKARAHLTVGGHSSSIHSPCSYRTVDEEDDLNNPETHPTLLLSSHFHTPRSSRSSLLHSYSGSMEISEGSSSIMGSSATLQIQPAPPPPAATPNLLMMDTSSNYLMASNSSQPSRARSFELGELRNPSLSVDADAFGRSHSMETRSSIAVTITSPRPERRAFLLRGSGGSPSGSFAGSNTLIVPHHGNITTGASGSTSTGNTSQGNTTGSRAVTGSSSIYSTGQQQQYSPVVKQASMPDVSTCNSAPPISPRNTYSSTSPAPPLPPPPVVSSSSRTSLATAYGISGSGVMSTCTTSTVTATSSTSSSSQAQPQLPQSFAMGAMTTNAAPAASSIPPAATVNINTGASKATASGITPSRSSSVTTSHSSTAPPATSTSASASLTSTSYSSSSYPSSPSMCNVTTPANKPPPPKIPPRRNPPMAGSLQRCLSPVNKPPLLKTKNLTCPSSSQSKFSSPSTTATATTTSSSASITTCTGGGCSGNCTASVTATQLANSTCDRVNNLINPTEGDQGREAKSHSSSASSLNRVTSCCDSSDSVVKDVKYSSDTDGDSINLPTSCGASTGTSYPIKSPTPGSNVASTSGGSIVRGHGKRTSRHDKRYHTADQIECCLTGQDGRSQDATSLIISTASTSTSSSSSSVPGGVLQSRHSLSSHEKPPGHPMVPVHRVTSQPSTTQSSQQQSLMVNTSASGSGSSNPDSCHCESKIIQVLSSGEAFGSPGSGGPEITSPPNTTTAKWASSPKQQHLDQHRQQELGTSTTSLNANSTTTTTMTTAATSPSVSAGSSKESASPRAPQQFQEEPLGVIKCCTKCGRRVESSTEYTKSSLGHNLFNPFISSESVHSSSGFSSSLSVASSESGSEYTSTIKNTETYTTAGNI